MISRFGALLPEGQYQPLLPQVEPRLIYPAKSGYYFAEEQVATWGLDFILGAAGLSAYPVLPDL